MKSVELSLLSALLFFSICINSTVRAEDYSFHIIEGQVDTTALFCATRPDCPVVTASLRGTFRADIKETTITFSDIQVSATPGTGFELPENPDVNDNGTTRKVVFSFDGEVLDVSGTENNSAFDGPLYEYRFTAETSGPAGFNPSGFFQARMDFRECVWPLCGGMFLSAVNKPYTRCADGSWAKECYVSLLNWDSLGFDPLEQENAFSSSATWLFQGRIQPMDYYDFENLGMFVGEGAYRPVSDNTQGRFFAGLHINDIVCITWPCFSADEYILNRNRSKAISGYDLNDAGASSEDMQAALDLLRDGEVLIAAGRNQWAKGPAGFGLSFVADQFYLPVRNDSRCEDGYEYREGACLTPHGCEAPLIELKTFAGIPNPETGEGAVWYDCVERCAPPQMVYVGPARCEVYMP